MTTPSGRVFYSERPLLGCGDVFDLVMMVLSWKPFYSALTKPTRRVFYSAMVASPTRA